LPATGAILTVAGVGTVVLAQFTSGVAGAAGGLTVVQVGLGGGVQVGLGGGVQVGGAVLGSVSGAVLGAVLGSVSGALSLDVVPGSPLRCGGSEPGWFCLLSCWPGWFCRSPCWPGWFCPSPC
jgi:hypothetical protein